MDGRRNTRWKFSNINFSDNIDILEHINNYTDNEVSRDN